MAVKFALPCACGHVLQVITAQAGEEAKCPSCGASVSVPSLRAMRELEVLGRPARRRRSGRWNARNACIVSGLVIAGAALVVMAVSWMSRPRPIDPAQWTLMDSWYVWMSLRQGPQRRVSWQTYQYLEALRILRIHMLSCLGVAVLGLVLSLTAFARRRNDR